MSLIAFEPGWSVYLPSSFGHWAKRMPMHPAVNLSFANPIFFVIAVGLLGLGIGKKWLSRYEALLAAGLLAIPYVTKAHPNMMESQGRYAAVAIPLYVVVGHILVRCPKPARAVFLIGCAVLTSCYAALFAAYYRVI